MLTIKELERLAKGLTILYVEDEAEVQTTMKGILENIFSRVLTALNGLDGIEIVKTNRVDLILSDINMPKCNGLDMIKAVKNIYPQMPTILLTGLEDKDFLLQSINLGINKYLVKPINKKLVFESLEEILYLIQSRQRYRAEQLGLSKNIKMIAIAKLLDNITHQWRQSLSIISTSIGAIVLNDDLGVSDGKIQDLLSLIDNHVKTMDEQLESLFINFKNEYKRETFYLHDFFKNSFLSFQKDIEKFKVETIINSPTTLTAYLHIQSLEQIIHNLLENSIDAIKNNNVQNSYIKISTTKQDGELIIDVIDNAGGVIESIKDDIFEPYSTTKHQFIGTGLGLYVVYILTTKALKGTIVNKNVKIDNQNCTKITISIPCL
jgi:YesN/AraC family two-component response regulator